MPYVEWSDRDARDERIRQLRNERPRASLRAIGREVGCSVHTVIEALHPDVKRLNNAKRAARARAHYKSLEQRAVKRANRRAEREKRGVPRRARSTHCYVIRTIEEPLRFKIGISRDVPLRLATLQGASPLQVELVAAWESNDAVEEEFGLLARFADARLHGEWFDGTDPALAAWVAALPCGGPIDRLVGAAAS
jgi:hypothetical protein